MKRLLGWKLVLLLVSVVGILGLGNSIRFNTNTKSTHIVVLANESARYLNSLFNGQIPPRFDSFANDGFGDMGFIFQYPLKIWMGIPALLLGFRGNVARSINLLASIGFFLWGMQKVEKLFMLRKLRLARAAVVVLVIVSLELVNNEHSIILMFLPWLVWSAARFVKPRPTQSHRLWPWVVSNDGLLLVLVLSTGFLTSSEMIVVSFGLVLGVLVTGTKNAVKPFILSLLWALANTAWFWLPLYAEQADVITDPYSANFIAKSFDAQKAAAIFDDYPNQKILSPNAAVKITSDKTMHSNKFSAFVPEKSLIIEKTMYFPGWKVKANGQPVTLENPDAYAGLVAYQLEAGTHEVQSQMTQRTWARSVGNGVSGISIAVWIWCLRQVTKSKRSGMTTLQRLFCTLVSNKEKLVKITKKFLPQRSR